MEDSIKIKLQEQKSEIREYKEKLDLIRRSLSIETKKRRLEEISKMEEDDSLWQNVKKAAEIQKEKKVLSSVVETFFDMEKMVSDYEVLEEFALNDGDDASAEEAIKLYPELKLKIDEGEQKVLLSDELDINNAIVSINAGAGGTESCDWAMMLMRMIIRWSESSGYRVKVLDALDGESAGIKSSTMVVNGEFAFGKLKSESGIHRLVRISPFDSNARRHTSFASIFVTAEVDDDIAIEVLDKDIKIDVYRSGGAGGQSVNTTDSAVRITHFPSGLVVTCQNERSQLQNKLFAMKILKSRLYEKEMEKRREEQERIEGEKREIGWGSQIRSYVLHPYKLVKDHRTGLELFTAEKVLDGDIDPFIKSFLQWKTVKNKQPLSPEILDDSLDKDL